jgi:hypothetical protein
MFTHLSGWKSRVEIDQRAREGRLRQEWREAPRENDRASIPAIFWSVLGLVAQSVESLLKPPHRSAAPQVQMWEIISRRDPLRAGKESLAPKDGSLSPSLCRHKTLRAAAWRYRRR